MTGMASRTIPYLVATVVVLAVARWISRPLGIALAVMAAGSFRGFVVDQAAFWNAPTVLTVGVAWGAIMALGISIASNAAEASGLIKFLLLVEGFFAVGYVGYAPSREDRLMDNKAGQTAAVGLICYILVGAALAIWGTW